MVRILPSRAVGGSMRAPRSTAATHRRLAIGRSRADLGRPRDHPRRPAGNRRLRIRESIRAWRRWRCHRRARCRIEGVYLYYSQYLARSLFPRGRGGAAGVGRSRCAGGEGDRLERGAWLPDGVRNAADAGEATIPRSIGNQRRVLGPVDSLEHLSRAVRDAPQPRQGRSVRAGRHLRVVFADAVGSHAVDRRRRRSSTAATGIRR